MLRVRMRLVSRICARLIDMGVATALTLVAHDPFNAVPLLALLV